VDDLGGSSRIIIISLYHGQSARIVSEYKNTVSKPLNNAPVQLLVPYHFLPPPHTAGMACTVAEQAEDTARPDYERRADL